jgi:hypothetical protein
VVDRLGNAATVSAAHTAAVPGRLDALATVLAGEEGGLSYVCGIVRRTAGSVVIEPIGLAADGHVVVPDLRPAGATAGLAVGDDHPGDALTAALVEARDLLAEAAHRGLDHLPPTYGAKLAAAARRMGTLGLRRVEKAVTAFEAALTHDCDQAAEQSWVDAYLRVDLALDLR